MPVKIVSLYTPLLIRCHREWLFLFGDNYLRQGRGGQAAVCRDQSNCLGIRVKWAPSMEDRAFFRDEQYDACTSMIEEDLVPAIEALQAGRTVVLPQDGIGTGRARLTQTAPRVREFLNNRLMALVMMAPGEMSLMEALIAQQDSHKSGTLLIWTVYRNPSDHPGKYVARPFDVRLGLARPEYLLADTLEEVRKLLPKGLSFLPRQYEDDPGIVESWI